MGGLRPAAGRLANPSRNPYQHVQSKLSGYLQGDEAAPQPRRKRSPQRRAGGRQSDRRGSKRPPRSGAASPPPSPTLASMPQLQLRKRIEELRKELSMGQSALAEYLATHGRSAEFDSFSAEVDRLAKKLQEMEARADANERVEQQSTQERPTLSTTAFAAGLSPVRLSVDCPDATSAGETILVETEWGEDLEVTVPEGIAPGQAFEFIVEKPAAQADGALQRDSKLHEDSSDRFEVAIPPTESSSPSRVPPTNQVQKKLVPELDGNERSAAVPTTPDGIQTGSVVAARVPEEVTSAVCSTASVSVLETEIKQLRAELSRARLEVETERAHSATAMVDMERRLASERDIAQEQLLDAKGAARRQVESMQEAVQELQRHLANERTARRVAEQDAERQRKDMATNRNKLRRIGLADCAAWACVHEEVVRLIDVERVAAIMAAEEAAEECEKAEEECEKAESELRSAELDWSVKEASLRQAMAEAESRARAADAAAAEADVAAQQARKAAAEQTAAAEDAARKLEKEQRNAVRARTAKSAQAWQEKQRGSSGNAGANSRPPASGSARERRHAQDSEHASTNRGSPRASKDASGSTEGTGQPEFTPRSSPGRTRSPLPSFKVVQPAPVRSRPSHSSAKLGFLKAGTVITPLEKNWGLKGETWLRCECPATDDRSGVRKMQGWVALLDEKRMKKPMRDFTLLVGSSFFHGFRKCIVRASTSSELLKAVMSALESQGVHIPPEAFPMQILHRDTEFQEALPVADLDMLNGKARVRLEQASPKDAAEQSVAAREGDFDAGRTGDSAQASASATPEAEIEKLRRSLQEAEARAASAAALQEQCDTLSNSLAAESNEREKLLRSTQIAEMQAQHFEARASTLQQVLTTLATSSADFPLDS